VVRTDEIILWGWHPESCSYHERWEWMVNSANKSENSGARLGRRMLATHKARWI
jgi:hypothetical protein